MRMPAFVKTIRFTLTMWYAAFLLLLGVVVLGGINLAMGGFGGGPLWRPDGGMSPQQMFEEVRSRNLEQLRNYSLISLAGVFAIGTVGGYFLSGRMLKPVDHVSSLAARISSTNLEERIDYQGPDDEMKRLADTFDGMLERLESAFEFQRQFVQDASHELRTPIAIAQTNIEVLEMEEEATIKDYKHLVEVIKLSLERMQRLDDGLLLLSDGIQDQVRWEIVDMGVLLDEVKVEFGTRARLADVDLEVKLAPGEMLVRGDAQYLKHAVGNLVDNAIKYNRPGGQVRVSTQPEESHLALEVEDSGVGIAQTDQQRVFDRFYRVDKSRSRAQGGSGLGLAIVKRIVEDHGGTISVKSAPDEGSTFRVLLPLHRPA